MIRRTDIVAEARSWIGTPHVWQQSQKGLGCDCKGLVVGVARELKLPQAQSIYARMMDYHRVDCELLREGMAELFDPGEMLPGDVLVLKMANRPQHLAILGENEIIHTYARGKERVTRTTLGAALRVWPLDSVWSWRGVG